MARVFVIDSSAEVRRVLTRVFQDAGLDVLAVGTGDEALRTMAERRDVDIVLLDPVLPGIAGLDLLSKLLQSSDVPVIVLSGESDEAERIAALELGADDYLVKPFSPPELLARVHAHLRRAAAQPPALRRLVFNGLAIDPSRREVIAHARPVDLTAREFDLLAFLAGSPGQVFTRTQLLTQVWGCGSEFQDPATVTEHVCRIRRKLEEGSTRPWIETVRGVGYRFDRRGGETGSPEAPPPPPDISPSHENLVPRRPRLTVLTRNIRTPGGADSTLNQASPDDARVARGRV